MANIIQLTLQNNDTVLPKGKRDILTFSSPYLVPCKVIESSDSFDMEFDLAGLKSFEEIKTLHLSDKYRFLCNCAKLERLGKTFSVDMSPENIYADMNLMPKILKRDVAEGRNDRFLEQYKALTGALLATKYTYEDYYNGGKDLYAKDKVLSCIYNNESPLTLAQVLEKEYCVEDDKIRNNMVSVSKRHLRIYKLLVPTLVVLTVICAGLLGYFQFIKLPFENKLIRANNAYLSNGYMTVQNELSDVSTDKLPNESKYILARSYVVGESLNTEQKENILTMLTPQTDPIYFDYWIELGKLNFDDAIEVAQRIGDDQLLLLAYIKYESFLETDTKTLSGTQKAEKISDLKSKIESLSSDIKSDRDEVTEKTETTDTTNETN